MELPSSERDWVSQNTIYLLKNYIDENHLEIDIEVDGGINLKTAPEVKKAGANILVAGTAILNAVDYKVIIDELKCPIGDASLWEKVYKNCKKQENMVSLTMTIV